jgi:NAD(P)H-nitrite reductase large subunit
LSGERRNLALLPNAYMQGETAGYSMAENEQRFENAIAMNAIGFFGLHIITAGIYQGEDLCFATEKGYKRLFIKDDHLVGCILIGDQVARGGIYTNLIRSRTDLRTLDFAMISEQPALMAFAQKVRSEQLGRAQ